MKANTAVTEIYHYLMLEVIIRKNSTGTIAYRFAEQEGKPTNLVRLGKKPAANKISGEDLFYDYQRKIMFFCYRNEKKHFCVGVIVDKEFGLALPEDVKIITDLPVRYVGKGIDQLRFRFKTAVSVNISDALQTFTIHPRFRKTIATAMKNTEHLDIVPDSIEEWALIQPDCIRNRLLMIQAKERFKNSIVNNT